MAYTIKYKQSLSEQNKQVELIAHYAHDPFIRYQPILMINQLYSVDRVAPFPPHSFESKEMICQGGQCREYMSHFIRITSINPYGI